MAFCIHTSPLTSWVRLYTIAFYGLFCIFTSFDELFIWVTFTFGHSSGDLFCTHALSWWHILYIGNIFVHYLFLWAILYIYFSLVSLSLLEKYFMTTCTSFWWPILSTHTYHEDLYSNDFYGLFHLFFFLVCLSSHILWLSSGDLFCTHTFISQTHSVHMDVFEG